MASKQKRVSSDPRPSSSVILVSPENKILLLQRVQTSSSFPSAYVFPGGNLDPFHDGQVPPPEHPSRHEDGEAYRLAAVRETFEESGILLARKVGGSGRLMEIDDREREEGRHLVHSNKIDFRTWLADRGGEADTENLIPFTRWITPTHVPKRFTTQMYIYLLPLSNTLPSSATTSSDSGKGTAVVIPAPTHDGGKEHNVARFLPPSTWLSLAQKDDLIMFPPQFFLLHMLSPFLPPSSPDGSSFEAGIEAELMNRGDEERLLAQRKAMLDFVRGGRWGSMCISPVVIAPSQGTERADGRAVMGLDKPGPELRGQREGERDHVVLVELRQEGPRRLEVRRRSEVLAEARAKV